MFSTTVILCYSALYGLLILKRNICGQVVSGEYLSQFHLLLIYYFLYINSCIYLFYEDIKKTCDLSQVLMVLLNSKSSQLIMAPFACSSGTRDMITGCYNLLNPTWNYLVHLLPPKSHI